MFIAKFVINNHANEFIKILLFLIINEYFFRLNLKSFKFIQQRVLLNKRRQKNLVNKVVEKIKTFRRYFVKNLSELKLNKQNMSIIIDHLFQNLKSIIKFY